MYYAVVTFFKDGSRKMTNYRLSLAEAEALCELMSAEYAAKVSRVYYESDMIDVIEGKLRNLEIIEYKGGVRQLPFYLEE